MKNTKAFRAAPQSGGIIMPEDLDFGLPPSKSKRIRKSDSRRTKKTEQKKVAPVQKSNIIAQEETVTLNLDVPDIESEELRFMVEEKYRALSKLGKDFEKDLTSMKALLMLEIRLREFSDAFHEEEVRDEPDESLLDAYVEKILEVDLPYEFDDLRTQAKNKLFECDTTQLLPELIQYIRDENSPTPNLNKMQTAFEKHEELKMEGDIITDLLENSISGCESDEFQALLDKSALSSALKQRVKDCIDDIGTAYDNNGLKKVDFQGYFKLVGSILDTVEESGDVSGDVNFETKFNMAGRSKSKSRVRTNNASMQNSTPTDRLPTVIQIGVQLLFFVVVAILAAYTLDTKTTKVVKYTLHGSNSDENLYYLFGKQSILNIAVAVSTLFATLGPSLLSSRSATQGVGSALSGLKAVLQGMLQRGSLLVFILIASEAYYVYSDGDKSFFDVLAKVSTKVWQWDIAGGSQSISDYVWPDKSSEKKYLLGLATKLYALDPGMPSRQVEGSNDLIATTNNEIVFQPFDFDNIFVNVNTQALLSKVESYETVNNPYHCGPFTSIKNGTSEAGFVLPTKRAFQNKALEQIRNRIRERLSNGLALSLHYRDCIIFDAQQQANLKSIYVKEKNGVLTDTLLPYGKLIFSVFGLVHSLVYEIEEKMAMLLCAQAALLIGIPLFSSVAFPTSFATTNVPEVNQFLRSKYPSDYSVFFIKNLEEGGIKRRGGSADIKRHDFLLYHDSEKGLRIAVTGPMNSDAQVFNLDSNSSQYGVYKPNKNKQFLYEIVDNTNDIGIILEPAAE